VSHTLLLADDSVTIQRVIELTFADEDISVVAFSDGDHAIASLTRTPPDIVLADIGMPGRSGYDVARYIKQTPELSHIPVLLLTGAFEPVDQEKVHEVGCDGVLTKPFEPQLVVSRVKELLAKSEQGAATTDVPSTAALKIDKASEIEAYFEQLDHAFATMTPPAPSTAPEPLPVVPVAPVESSQPTASGPDLADAFGALLAAERSGASAAAALAVLAPPPSIDLGEIVEKTTAQVIARLSDGPLREAAAAALAPTAERAVGSAITDVVTPIAERVVRSAIVDIVSATAERLIREEIERIKSNIK
jgi:CheY-like chemotaxis protein